MAGLFGALVRPLRKDVAVGSELYGAADGWGISSSGVPVNAFSALQHSPVTACVEILSTDVAKLPVRLMRRLPNGGKQQIKDHFLAKLFKKPNDYQNFFEFMEQMVANLVLRGNAYAPIIRNMRGEAEQLIPVHPDRCTLFEAPGGEYFFFVTRQGLHEMAALSSLPLMIASEDILHIRWLSTYNSLLGTSRIGLIREAVGLSMALEQHQARLMGQGARPGGVLSTDRKLSPETAPRVKADWQQNYGGFRNAGKTAVLEEGLKWTPITMTNVEAEFAASRLYQLEEVARAFRIPRHKLGLKVEGEATGLSQYEQAYWNDTISAYVTRFKLKFEELAGLDGDDIFVDFDYNVLLQADKFSRYETHRLGIMSGIVTPNECRGDEGLAKMEGGETLFRPANLVPIATPIASTSTTGGVGSDITGEPAPGGSGDSLRSRPLPAGRRGGRRVDVW